MRELELVERIRAGGKVLPTAVRVGIGDDCAVLRVPRGCEMVVTTDFSLEGRHFRRDWHSAESAGHRCLARGLSDVAAMGARPLAAFLSLALPRGFDLAWVDGFLHGFRALGDRFGVALAGGDTAEAPGEAILADVIVTGAVKQGRALLRSGARPGDLLYVTGRLGGSALELAAMAAGAHGTHGPQSFPEPRLAVGLALVRRGIASACMDLSDGISTDLRHLCLASGVGAELDQIPLASGATLEQGLHGGEDYELLFTSSGKVPSKIASVPITCIGRIVAGDSIAFQGQVLHAAGWEHFGGQSGV